MTQCKYVNNKGKRCLRKSCLGGYCIQHFDVNIKPNNVLKKRKKKQNKYIQKIWGK